MLISRDNLLAYSVHKGYPIAKPAICVALLFPSVLLTVYDGVYHTPLDRFAMVGISTV